MGAFGVVSSMISSIRENTRLLPKSKSPTERSREYSLNKKPQPLKYENRMSPEEHENFLEHLNRSKRKSIVQLIIVIGIVVLSVGAILVLIST